MAISGGSHQPLAPTPSPPAGRGRPRRSRGWVRAPCHAPEVAIVWRPPAPDTRRKRLLFRSWHRGTREADLILGSFAEANLAGFDDGQLDRYEALLNVPDPDLFDWIVGRADPPPECDHD